MNHFIHQSAAERYARGRPYFHPLVIERVRTFLQLDRPVSFALDVACGTGQSALALTQIAISVIATDISSAMLSQAPAHPRIRYEQAPAEQLPLERHSIDLITVSLAFHWLDRLRFLAEARRVLRPRGTLVIYWNDFYGEMKETAEFTSWTFNSYLKRYPKPSRNDAPFSEADARTSGFAFLHRERYTNEIEFSPEELISCLLTHSNIIAAVEEGHESIRDAHSWLLDSVSPLFKGPTGTFTFGGEIWYLRRFE
jgi:ubiquinone/menaquinone biosynthesis C-methylase UbiE